MNETSARSAPRPGLILTLLALAQFMTAIDFDIVFVALPEIGRQLDFSEQSLYGCLEEKYGVSIAQQDLSVSLRVPSRDEARTLGITDRQPRLSLQITACSSDGEPFLYGESVFVSTDAHIYFTAGGYRSENP